MSYSAIGAGGAKIKDEESCVELKKYMKIKQQNVGLDYDIYNIKKKDFYIDIYDKEEYCEDNTMEFLDTITPFVEEGCLEYTGEDDCHWRFVLKDGKWVKETGTINYGFESFTDKEMIQELERRGYQVTKAA